MSLTWAPFLEALLRDLTHSQGHEIAPGSWCMITDGPAVAQFLDGIELDIDHYHTNAILRNNVSQTCDEGMFLLPSMFPQDNLDSYIVNYDESTGIFHVASRYRSMSFKGLLELRDPASPLSSTHSAEFLNGKVTAVPRQDSVNTGRKSKPDQHRRQLQDMESFVEQFDPVERVSQNLAKIDPSFSDTCSTVTACAQAGEPQQSTQHTQNPDGGVGQPGPVKPNSPSLLDIDSPILKLGPAVCHANTGLSSRPLSAFKYTKCLSEWLVMTIEKETSRDVESQAERSEQAIPSEPSSENSNSELRVSIHASKNCSPVLSLSSGQVSALSLFQAGASPFVTKSRMKHTKRFSSRDDSGIELRTKPTILGSFDDLVAEDRLDDSVVPNTNFLQVQYRTPRPPSPHGTLHIGEDGIIREVCLRPVDNRTNHLASPSCLGSSIEDVPEVFATMSFTTHQACEDGEISREELDSSIPTAAPVSYPPFHRRLIQDMPTFSIDMNVVPPCCNALDLLPLESWAKWTSSVSHLDLSLISERMQKAHRVVEKHLPASSEGVDVCIVLEKDSGELYLLPVSDNHSELPFVHHQKSSKSSIGRAVDVVDRILPQDEAQQETRHEETTVKVGAGTDGEVQPDSEANLETGKDDDSRIKGHAALRQNAPDLDSTPSFSSQSSSDDLYTDAILGDEECFDFHSRAPEVHLPGLFAICSATAVNVPEATPAMVTVPTLEAAIAKNSLSLCSHLSEETIDMMRDVNSLFYQIWKEGQGEEYFTPGQDERKVLALAVEQFESNTGSKICLDLLELVKDFVAVYSEIWSQGHPKNGMWRENEDEFFVIAFAVKAVEWKQMVAASKDLRGTIRLQRGSMVMGKAPSSSGWYLEYLGGDGQFREHRRVKATKIDNTESGLGGGIIHHINFNGCPVYKRCCTPAEVSFWAAATTYDKDVFNKPLPFVHHARVVTSQAFRWVDPTKYNGEDKYALWEKRGSAMRNAATSDVEVVYQPIGTWLYDEYTEDDIVPRVAPSDLSYEYATSGYYHKFQLPYLFNYSDDEHVMYNVNEAKPSDFVCTRVEYNRTAYKRERMSGLRYELGEGPKKKAPLIEKRLEKNLLPKKLLSFMETVTEEAPSDDVDANDRDDENMSEAETDIQKSHDNKGEPNTLMDSGAEQSLAVDVNDITSEDTKASRAETETLDEQIPITEPANFSGTGVGRPPSVLTEDPADINVGAMMKAGRDLIAKLRAQYRSSRLYAEDSDDDATSSETSEKEYFDSDNGITDHNSVWAEQPEPIDHPKAKLLARFFESENSSATPELTDDSSDSESEIPEGHEQSSHALSPANGRYCSPTKMAPSRMDEVHAPVQSPSKAEDFCCWELDHDGDWPTSNKTEAVSILASSNDDATPEKFREDLSAADMVPEFRLKSIAGTLTEDQTATLSRIFTSAAATQGPVNGPANHSAINAAFGEDCRVQPTGESWDNDDVFGPVVESEAGPQTSARAEEYPAAPQECSRAKLTVDQGALSNAGRLKRILDTLSPFQEGSLKSKASPVEVRERAIRRPSQASPTLCDFPSIRALKTQPSMSNEEVIQTALRIVAIQDKKRSNRTPNVDPELEDDYDGGIRQGNVSEDPSPTTTAQHSRDSSRDFSIKTAPSSVAEEDVPLADKHVNSVPGKLEINEHSPTWLPLVRCIKRIAEAHENLPRKDGEVGTLAVAALSRLGASSREVCDIARGWVKVGEMSWMSVKDVLGEEQDFKLPLEIMADVSTTRDPKVAIENRESASLTICHYNVVDIPPSVPRNPSTTFTICHCNCIGSPPTQPKQERKGDLEEPDADDINMERYMLAPLAVAGVGWVLWSLAKWALRGSQR